MKKLIIVTVFIACLTLCAAVWPQTEATEETIPAPTPTSSQTVTDPKLGDKVYVPGFGWLECQGPGEVIHDESIYENGNKIGIMG